MNTNATRPVRHGDQIEIEIQSLAFGGDAVGRYQDFAIFVPGGLPGERVRIKINQVKDHYAAGEILSILRPSPDRVSPVCSIFEECGGCQWQHFNYPVQLKTKRQFVVDSLARIGRLPNVTVQPCLPSPSPFAYRNKAMPVMSMRDGHFVAGIYEPRSHHLVPYHTCPIQAEPINDFIQKVLKKIDRSGLTPYQEKKHTGFLRHVAVRRGLKTGEMLLAFVTRTEVPEQRLQKPTVLPEEMDHILPRIARELMEETPGLVGVLQNINASRTNIVFGPTTRVLAGRDHYFEVVDDLKLKVSLKSFLQVNTQQADILHAVVREALGDPLHKKKWGTVLDLYSGIGTLAMAVAEKADYVVGVEEVGPAVDDARANAELNQKGNIDFLEGDVAQILLGLKDKGLSRIDAAVLDPPRKGVLPEVLARVAAFLPERLVYVSCDPSTLARDLALLAKQGYGVDWAQPLDMFPQTYHVETVVRLTRETPLPPEILNPAGEPQLEPFRLPKPPQGTPSNVRDNLRALKENAATLLQSSASLVKASAGLGGSVVSGLLGWTLKGFRSGGKEAVRPDSPTAAEALQKLERLEAAVEAGEASAAMQVDAAARPAEGPPEATPSLAGEEPETPARQSVPAPEAPLAAPALSQPEGALAAESAPAVPQAGGTTVSEPVVSTSIPPQAFDKAAGGPLPPVLPGPALKDKEAEAGPFPEPEPPVPGGQPSVISLGPGLEKAVDDMTPAVPGAPAGVSEEPVLPAIPLGPALERTAEGPEAPAAEVPLQPAPPPSSLEPVPEKPAAVEASVPGPDTAAPPQGVPGESEAVPAVLAAPAEKAVSEPVQPPPVLPEPSTEFVPPRRRSMWGWLSTPVALPRMGVPKGLRWVLATLFLVSGAMFAKATFSPVLRKTSALVPTVSQMIPDVIAVMPTRDFLRYEMVPFEVRVNPAEMSNFQQMKVTVEVYRGGVPVTMVDDRTQLILRKDRQNGRFVGNWPIPYNPDPGTYVAQVVVSGPQWGSSKIFESAFTIAPLKPHGLFPGYAALTMEGGKQMVGGAVPDLDGGDSLKAVNAIKWAKFMGANIYCYLMGQTSAWDHFNPKEFPFDRGDITTGHKYARLAHEAGLKFAGYLTTFKVVGDAWNQCPYQFSLGYDPDTDKVVPTRFISLEDPKRHRDVIQFLKDLNADPNIDCIGLDYVRTGPAGYEMVDQFVKDLNVPGPADFWSMSEQQRILWLARTVELKKDPRVVKLFDWWKAHKVAMVVKGILDAVKPTKPVFTFTLGWQMGHQHGQDPAMLVDAGVGFNHIMLYQGDRNTLRSMNRQWPEYLSRDNGMYAIGEMVDFNWVQKSIDPPAPEELYRREVDTFHKWFQVNSGMGMFWHDLYRICYGVRGPYSSMEWAIAGGKAFSDLKETEGLLPVEVSIQAPREAPGGVPIPIRVEVRNHSPEDLKGLVLHQIDTSKDYYTDLATVGPFDLPAGNIVRVKSLYVTLPREDEPERGNRYMAAVVVDKPGQSLRAFDFTYMKKIPAGVVPRSMDVAPQKGASPPASNGTPEGKTP